MSRVEHIGDATLYLGDVIELEGSAYRGADAIITDPVWPNCPKGLLPGSENPSFLFANFWTVAPATKRAVIVNAP